MIIQTTPEHQAIGDSRCTSCPIALAVKDALKPIAAYVFASPVNIIVERISHLGPKSYQTFPTPPHVKNFMIAHDRGNNPHPVSFELDINLELLK